jgi:chemotaxis protein MotB
MLLFFFFMAGCMVSKGTYLKSVQESETLNRDLTVLQEKYDALQADNEGLNEQIKKLKSEIEELENVLLAKSDELTSKILELKQKLSDLERENADLKKAKEEKNRRIIELEQEIMEIKAEKAESVKEISEAYNAMIEKMKSEIADGQVTITELKGKLTVNMLDAVLFDLGKADVRPEGLVVLQKVIDVLKGVKDRVIRVEGHTDNLKIFGNLAKKYSTNWELSAARAINVTKYLQSQGIDPNILSATAFGEYKSVATNDTEEGRAQNRRIEIVLIPKELR